MTLQSIEQRIAQSLNRPLLPDDQSLRRAVKTLSALTGGHGWVGDTATLSAALPHRFGALTGWDLLDALKTLRLPLAVAPLGADDAAQIPLPCLIIRKDDSYGLITDYHPDLGFKAVEDDRSRWIGADRKDSMVVKLQDADEQELYAQPRSAAETLAGLLPQIWPLFFASLLISLLGLATPFIVMTVYNTAIPAGSTGFLVALAAGLALAYLAELMIRRIRSAALVRLAAGLENRLGLSLLQKLVLLPVAVITRSDAFQQRARLRQFESMRDAMMGPLVQAALDLPFLILFATALFMISPTIGWVTLAFALLNAAGFVITGPLQRRYEAAASDARTNLRKITLETVNGQAAIRRAGTEDIWRQRLEDAAAQAQTTTLQAQRFSLCVRTILQAIMTIAGISAGFLASYQVMLGGLSLGGLVAVLILVWRFLAPVQTLSLAAEQALAIYANIKMINTVLQMPEEKHRSVSPLQSAPIIGHIQCEQVTFRYPQAHLPALAAVSFGLQPGETLIVTGKTMAGKTCLAEMLTGLHQPLGGRILIDGQDIRQIHVDDLRTAISFFQQETAVFYGTILQNLAFAAPLLTEQDAWQALQDAGIADRIAQLPDSIHTRLTQDTFQDLPMPLRKGICLAMTLIRKTPIYIFDQPTAGLDQAHAAILRDSIAARKTASAIILITHDPADMALGDRFMVLDRGRVLQNERGARGRDKALSLTQGRTRHHAA